MWRWFRGLRRLNQIPASRGAIWVAGRASPRRFWLQPTRRDARELARDLPIDQFFRREPAAKIEYVISTPAGRLSFDNAAARHIVGVEAGCAPVEKLNQAIREWLGGAEEIPCVAMPCGMALLDSGDLLGRLRDGTCAADDEYSSWVGLQLRRC
jgi:hypothetical protein